MKARRKELSHRGGFTLIELLVVISIIATLMSLILPAIQNAREAARRTECLNNQKNLATAAHSYASANKGKLPAQGHWIDHDGDLGIMTPSLQGRSWVVDLLPYLDQQSLYDRWNFDLAWSDASVSAGGMSNVAIGQTALKVLTCQDDDTAFQQPGGLSYVANAGYGSAINGFVQDFTEENFDWNTQATSGFFRTGEDQTGQKGDPVDQAITRGTGIFWREDGDDPSTKNPSASLGRIYDGSSNTLMFGENVNAGAILNWGSQNASFNVFMLPVMGGTAMAGDSSRASNGFFANPDAAILAVSGVTEKPFPNQHKHGPENKPYLSSGHPGIVTASMCDGSVRSISESIEHRVYCSLITPDGSRLRSIGVNWTAEKPISPP
ncbi:MAG: DUF1559 domain-containing protein [Planctomycetaceae bacterium]